MSGFVSTFLNFFGFLGSCVVEACRVLDLRTGAGGIIAEACATASVGMVAGDGTAAAETEDRFRFAIVEMDGLGT